MPKSINQSADASAHLFMGIFCGENSICIPSNLKEHNALLLTRVPISNWELWFSCFLLTLYRLTTIPQVHGH